MLYTPLMSNISLLILFSEKSFNDIDAWLKDLKTNSSPDIKVFLIGNKCDMETSRAVPIEEGEGKAQRNGVAFLETSALNATNVEKAFDGLIKKLYVAFKQDFENDEEEDLGENPHANTIEIGTDKMKKMAYTMY